MNGVKGKVLKKIKAIGYLKPERILALLDGNIQDVDDQDLKIMGSADKEKDVSISSFRPPDLNSRTLFDPNLLAAFEQAVMEFKARMIDVTELINDLDDQELIMGSGADKENEGSRCLSESSVVLYTTGIRGIRKTFEDCQKIRSLLENLKVVFYERDISMHSEFKEELWRILGGKVVPPRLFIKGMYIGGAQEVLGLHEQGKLKPLIQGIPVIQNNQGPCQGCVGFRFIVCFNCNGSRRVLHGGQEADIIHCTECNENGLVICPFCC